MPDTQMKLTSLVYTDGGCYNNDKIDPIGYGSYKCYNIESFEYVPDHGYMAQCTPIFESMRFAMFTEYMTTNNLSEYIALLTTANMIKREGLVSNGNRVMINMDSALIINQFYGLFRCKDIALLEVHEQIKQVMGLMNNPHRDKRLIINKISGDNMKVVLGH